MSRSIQLAAALVSAALFHTPARAQVDPFPGVSLIPITAEQARQVKRELREGVLFVDVRHPMGKRSPHIDAQIPFSEMPLSFENDINAALASRGLRFTDPVIVISRDGRHARSVSERLAEIGYSQVLVVVDGFEELATQTASAGTKP
jgi:rhodanese-related sulfurtransferase